MTAVILPMATSNPLKRTFQDADFQNSSSNIIESSDGSDRTVSHLQPERPQTQNETLSLGHGTETSTVFNLSSESKTFDSTIGEDVVSTVATIPNSTTNSKRRKVTSAEQEVRRLEKEAKDRQRAEEKAKLEESRRAKEIEREESKRAKEIEREEKRKEKETQTRQKEEERKKKEEAKTKKDKA